VRGTIVWAVLALAGCTSLGGDAGFEEPATDKPAQAIDVLGIVRQPFASEFRVSGAVPLDGCRVVLAESERGAVASADFSRGNVEQSSARNPTLPIAPAVSSLRTGAAYWSIAPHGLASIGPNLEIDSVEVPLHPWGERYAGPLFDLGNLGVAMVPLGSSRPIASSPTPWIDAPLFLLSSDGLGDWEPHGSVVKYDGDWLTWRRNRAVLGSRGDTVLALMLSSGELRRYLIEDDSSTLVSKDTLPRLVPYIEPTEHSLRSILRGGNRHVISGFYQVLSAAFLPDGSFVAIRPTQVTRVRVKDLDFGRIFRWVVGETALERYSSRGELIGRIPLGTESLKALRARPGGFELTAMFRDSVLVFAPRGEPRATCWKDPGDVLELPLRLAAGARG
jgi:hypothetical protein